MGDALELSGEEGRGKLRKTAVRGKHSLTRRCPNGVTRLAECWSLYSESIAVWSNTQGTEPSKYLKEKKSNEIPVVAASEVGRAQTGCVYISGVVGRFIVSQKLSL